jgi:hypothetical protein
MLAVGHSASVLLVTVSLLVPQLLVAQAPVAARQGSPVRFGLVCAGDSCPRQKGSLRAATADSVVIEAKGDRLLALAWSDVAWMEVGRNRHGARTGAIIGGGVLGLSTAALAVGVCVVEPWDDDGCPAGAVVLTTLVGVGVGAGIGALLGAVIAPTQWRPVSPGTLRVAVVPLPGARTGVGFSLPIGARSPGVHQALLP